MIEGDYSHILAGVAKRFNSLVSELLFTPRGSKQVNQANKRIILSIMGIKDKTLSSWAQIMVLALLACRCSAGI